VTGGGAVIGQTLKGYALVLAAATLWATIGLFYKVIIGGYGMTPLSAVLARGATACVMLIAGLAIWKRDLLRVRRQDLPFFAVMGLITVAIFFSLYAYAITLVGMSVAAVLQYTAPAFVVIIAWRVFREPLDRIKILALLLALAGCVLIAQLYNLTSVTLNLPGVLCGLATGLTFGLYTIFNKRAVQTYSPWTIITYNLTFGMLFLALLQAPQAVSELAARPGVWPWILLVAILPTVAAHGLYVSGLAYVPAGNASIMGTWEPALATILAYIILGERLDALQLVGAACIVLGVIILSKEKL
jgi:drug/metabolite transporter, DME family